MANRDNSGRFQPGGPSANPLGRGAAIAKSNQAPGFDGISASGGYVAQPQDTPAFLRGAQRWRTHDKIRKRTPVSIATQLRWSLFSGVQWDLEANESGSPDADRGLEIVRRGLLEARLESGRTWQETVAMAADGRYFEGHAVFALAIARTSSGLIGYTDLAHRPQRTIERWLRAVETDEATPFARVEQRSPMGKVVELDLSECFYVANHAGGVDAPTGRAALDDIADRWDKLTRYEALEGTELFSSLGGTPIARIPSGELQDNAEQRHRGNAEKIAEYISTRTRGILDFVAKRIKSPDVQQYLTLPSEPYKDPVTGSYSTTQKWGIEIVKGELQGLTEVRQIIRDFDLDIARMLGVEFVMVGGGDTAGTFGMHESKISMLGATLSAESWMLARAAEDQLARRLVAANGLDPDTATPYLVPSPIAVDDVLKAAQALVALNAAGLARNHPAKRTIFDRLHLPWEDEEAPSLALPGFGSGLGMLGSGGSAPSPPPSTGTTITLADRPAAGKLFSDRDLLAIVDGKERDE